MTNLTLWMFTILLFIGTYALLVLTPASDLPWQVKSVIWSNIGLLELLLLSSQVSRH